MTKGQSNWLSFYSMWRQNSLAVKQGPRHSKTRDPRIDPIVGSSTQRRGSKSTTRVAPSPPPAPYSNDDDGTMLTPRAACGKCLCIQYLSNNEEHKSSHHHQARTAHETKERRAIREAHRCQFARQIDFVFVCVMRIEWIGGC